MSEAPSPSKVKRSIDDARNFAATGDAEPTTGTPRDHKDPQQSPPPGGKSSARRASDGRTGRRADGSEGTPRASVRSPDSDDEFMSGPPAGDSARGATNDRERMSPENDEQGTDVEEREEGEDVEEERETSADRALANPFRLTDEEEAAETERTEKELYEEVDIKDGERFAIIVDKEERIFFEVERTNANVLLRQNGLAAEEEVKDHNKTIEETVGKIADRNAEAIAPSRLAQKEYQEGYAWPRLAPCTARQIVKLYKMEVPPRRVEEANKKFAPCTEQYQTVGQPMLERLRHKIEKQIRKEEAQWDLEEISGDLIYDKTLPKDVLIPLHELCFSDGFAFVKSELEKLDGKTGPLMDALQIESQAKADAVVAEDVRAVEQHSYRELDLIEKIMAIQRDRVGVVFAANEDAKAFCDNYVALRDRAEEVLSDQRALLDARSEMISADMEKLADKMAEEEERDTKVQTAHVNSLDRNKDSVRQIEMRQEAIWAQIRALLAENSDLSNKRGDLMQERMEILAKARKEREEFEALSRGLVQHGEALDSSKGILDLGKRWVDDVANYVAYMCNEIEKKEVDDEALFLRQQEQLEYLRQYTQYRRWVDELGHRKEIRRIAVGRMERHLELQIEEATTILDPHKKKYERELDDLHGQQDVAARDFDMLKTRAQRERTYWKPTEEQLEDDGVDFDPPDLVAEKERVDRKNDALKITRDFVMTEQENVDRDTMSLRKLKMSHKVANEGFVKRRETRRALSSSPTRDGSPANDRVISPPPQQDRPATTPATQKPATTNDDAGAAADSYSTPQKTQPRGQQQRSQIPPVSVQDPNSNPQDSSTPQRGGNAPGGGRKPPLSPRSSGRVDGASSPTDPLVVAAGREQVGTRPRRDEDLMTSGASSPNPSARHGSAGRRGTSTSATDDHPGGMPPTKARSGDIPPSTSHSDDDALRAAVAKERERQQRQQQEQQDTDAKAAEAASPAPQEGGGDGDDSPPPPELNRTRPRKPKQPKQPQQE